MPRQHYLGPNSWRLSSRPALLLTGPCEPQHSVADAVRRAHMSWCGAAGVLSVSHVMEIEGGLPGKPARWNRREGDGAKSRAKTISISAYYSQGLAVAAGGGGSQTLKGILNTITGRLVRTVLPVGRFDFPHRNHSRRRQMLGIDRAVSVSEDGSGGSGSALLSRFSASNTRVGGATAGWRSLFRGCASGVLLVPSLVSQARRACSSPERESPSGFFRSFSVDADAPAMPDSAGGRS